MDTSETYIKMCEKAEEIQKLRQVEFHSFCIIFPWQDGDFLVPTNKQKIDGKEVVTYTQALFFGGDFFWLPRQDQLQEMIWEKGYTVYDLISGVEAFLCEKYGNGYTLFEDEKLSREITSMEQLWLAFVMKEKYGKTWNGEEWIGIK